MVRLGREWTRADVVAAALIRRADVLTTLDPLGIRKPMSDARSDYALPQDMLLVLDAYGHAAPRGMGRISGSPARARRCDAGPRGRRGWWSARARGRLRRLTDRRRQRHRDRRRALHGVAQKAALGLIERLTG